jgi:hypothetical protein
MNADEPDLDAHFAPALAAWRESPEVQALLHLKDSCRQYRRFCVSCKEHNRCGPGAADVALLPQRFAGLGVAQSRVEGREPPLRSFGFRVGAAR